VPAPDELHEEDAGTDSESDDAASPPSKRTSVGQDVGSTPEGATRDTTKKMSHSIIVKAFQLKDNHLICEWPVGVDHNNGPQHVSIIANHRKSADRHLQRWHPAVHQALKKKQAEMPNKSFDDVVAAVRASFPVSKTPAKPNPTITAFCKAVQRRPRTVETELLVTMWAAAADIPLHAFDNARWKELLAHLGGDMRSSTMIRRQVAPSLAAAVEARANTELVAAKYLSVSMDGWDRDDKHERILGALVHYLDPTTLEPKHRVLCVSVVRGSATGEALEEAVRGAVTRRGGDEHIIVGTVTDGGGNYAKAGKLLLDNEWSKHWHCICHVLNLIVKDSLEGTLPFAHQSNSRTGTDLVTVALEVVHWYRGSSKREEALSKHQLAAGKHVLKLQSFSPTRWNGALLTIERLLELKDTVNAVTTQYLKRPKSTAAILC
jgi:hypothetical protein